MKLREKWSKNDIKRNSALHPSEVTKSSPSFGWGKVVIVTSARWQVTLCYHIWRANSQSGEAGCKRLSDVLFTYFKGIGCIVVLNSADVCKSGTENTYTLGYSIQFCNNRSDSFLGLFVRYPNLPLIFNVYFGVFDFNGLFCCLWVYWWISLYVWVLASSLPSQELSGKNIYQMICFCFMENKTLIHFSCEPALVFYHIILFSACCFGIV